MESRLTVKRDFKEYTIGSFKFKFLFIPLNAYFKQKSKKQL